MPTFLRLVLVRHGQVAANRDFRYVGSNDEPLTDVGREQARLLGVAIAQISPLRLYSSPLLRALETARAIGDRSGVQIEVDPTLREQSFGRWEGLTRSEVAELSREDAEILQRFDRCAEVAPPGGESHLELRSRLLSLIERLEGLQDHGGAPIVLVSHVDVLSPRS